MARTEQYQVRCGKCHGSQTQWVKCGCRNGSIGKDKYGNDVTCGQCNGLGEVEQICDRCNGSGEETMTRIVKD